MVMLLGIQILCMRWTIISASEPQLILARFWGIILKIWSVGRVSSSVLDDGGMQTASAAQHVTYIIKPQ